jgi:hypothetical protein
MRQWIEGKNPGTAAVVCVALASAVWAASPPEFGRAELNAALALRHPKYKPKVTAEMNLDPPETFRIEPYRGGGGHVTGGDLRGLMYGLLEAAEQMRAYGRLKKEHGTPILTPRGVRIEAEPDALWFQSRQFWSGFFAEMARDRFNRANFFFGRVPERRSFLTLRMISQTASEYGVDFVLGVGSLAKAGDFAPELHELLVECPLIRAVVIDSVAGPNGESRDPERASRSGALFQALEGSGRRVVLEVRENAEGTDADALALVREASDKGLPAHVFARYDCDESADGCAHEGTDPNPRPPGFYWEVGRPEPGETGAASVLARLQDLGAGFEIPAPHAADGRPEVRGIADWGRLGYDPKPPDPEPAKPGSATRKRKRRVK